MLTIRLDSTRIARFDLRKVESTTFATLLNVHIFLAVFFLSLSRTDFRRVESTCTQASRVGPSRVVSIRQPFHLPTYFILYFFLSLSQIDFR